MTIRQQKQYKKAVKDFYFLQECDEFMSYFTNTSIEYIDKQFSIKDGCALLNIKGFIGDHRLTYHLKFFWYYKEDKIKTETTFQEHYGISDIKWMPFIKTFEIKEFDSLNNLNHHLSIETKTYAKRIRDTNQFLLNPKRSKIEIIEKTKDKSDNFIINEFNCKSMRYKKSKPINHFV